MMTYGIVSIGVKRCLDNFTGDRKAIVGIGLCTIRCCRVLLKENGTGLSRDKLDGCQINRPYEHSDDRVKYVTTTSGYLGLRLTGEYKDSASNCEVYWPLDRQTLDWSKDKEVIEENGLRREMVFHLVKPGEKLGAKRRFNQ